MIAVGRKPAPEHLRIIVLAKHLAPRFHLGDALKRTVLIISFIGDTKLTPQTVYANWFANSIYLMTLMAITYAGFAFFRPILYHYRTVPLERLRASGILGEYGRSSLDFFKLWSDKSYYFNDEGNCFIAYRVGNNYAMVLSDPVGPEGKVEETVRGFMEFCHVNGWGVAFHQVTQDFLAIYERVGLKHLKIGDEAIVHLTNFDLEGSERKSLRKTVRRLETKGFTMREYQPPIPDAILREAKSVSDDWLKLPGRRERQGHGQGRDAADVRGVHQSPRRDQGARHRDRSRRSEASCRSSSDRSPRR